MSDAESHAVTTIRVSNTCEAHGCESAADVSMIVKGEYGNDAIAGYCDPCAAERSNSDHHTAIGEVSRE